MVGPSSSSGGPVPVPDPDVLIRRTAYRVRAEREARGWSRTELARRARLKPWDVRKIEEGRVPLHDLLKACAGLGVSLDVLLSEQWQNPALRPTLALRQVDVLKAAASGDSLRVVGQRLGMGSQAVGATLSRIYVRLGVANLPPEERRAAAARVAQLHGLLDAA